jgi:uncharacterized spore protein YtfJ
VTGIYDLDTVLVQDISEELRELTAAEKASIGADTEMADFWNMDYGTTKGKNARSKGGNGGGGGGGIKIKTQKVI